MEESSETIRWLVEVMVPVAGAVALFYKMVTGRPTFAQVRELIGDHALGSDYARDKGAIMARFDHQDKVIEKVDRHVDEIKAKVEEILIDVETQRRMRMKNGLP